MMRMLLLAILCMVLITEYSGGKIDGVYVVVEIFHSINVCKAKLEIKTLFVASSRSILPMPMQCMHHQGKNSLMHEYAVNAVYAVNAF